MPASFLATLIYWCWIDLWLCIALRLPTQPARMVCHKAKSLAPASQGLGVVLNGQDSLARAGLGEVLAPRERAVCVFRRFLTHFVLIKFPFPFRKIHFSRNMTVGQALDGIELGWKP